LPSHLTPLLPPPMFEPPCNSPLLSPLGVDNLLTMATTTKCAFKVLERFILRRREQNFYPQVQILHWCIISSLWVEPTNTTWVLLLVLLVNYRPNGWFRWFVISSLSPICSPNFSYKFYGGQILGWGRSRIEESRRCSNTLGWGHLLKGGPMQGPIPVMPLSVGLSPVRGLPKFKEKR
jgi:hypothetical protein